LSEKGNLTRFQAAAIDQSIDRPTAPQRQDNEQKNQWDREAAQPDAGILGSVRRWFWTKKKAVNRVVSIAAQ